MCFFVELVNPYRAVVPRLRRAMTTTSSDRILDLCSGGSGPVVIIHQELAATGVAVPATLTDKFPTGPPLSTRGGVPMVESTSLIPPLMLPPCRPIFQGFGPFLLGCITSVPKLRGTSCKTQWTRGDPSGFSRSRSVVCRTCLAPLCFPQRSGCSRHLFVPSAGAGYSGPTSYRSFLCL